MSTEDGNEVVPPFVEETNHKKKSYNERGFLSQATMLVGFAALTLSMAAGIWLIWKVLDNGLMNNLDMAFIGIIPIGLAYMAGWIFSILSIRAFNNLVFPLLIRYYCWFTLTGVLVLYIKVIQKLFDQRYEFPNFIAYNVILMGVLLALFGLHLLPEEHDLRPFSIPIFSIGLLQLVMMIFRYVLIPINGNGIYIFGDLFIFILMQTIAGLMMAHFGIFHPLRKLIGDFFREKGHVFH